MRDGALITGAQRGRAIFAGNNSGTHTVNVTGSTVSGYQKNGIDMRGTGLTANITGNMITGAGATGAIAQNGIVFLDATGTISGNTVEDHEYTGVDAATGILLFSGAAGTVVTGNFLNDNEVGVYTNISATIGGPTVADGNTITGSSVAGIVAAGGSVKIEHNTILGSAGNQVGIQVSDDAAVDAGGGALGSTGFNVLTGYTGVGGNYAIENLNLDVPNNVDVYADEQQLRQRDSGRHRTGRVPHGRRFPVHASLLHSGHST